MKLLIVTDVQENNKGVNNKTIYLKESAVHSSFQEYSRWKEEKNAHPKSDYESLRKWLNQKRTNVVYKTNITAVKETGIDEVSQETLDILPF